MEEYEEDDISVGDLVVNDRAPEPPGDSEFTYSPMRGNVLATYGSQALVDFGDKGEHYMPKKWLSKTRSELAELIEDIWEHAKVTSETPDIVEFELYAADFKVVKDPPGVSVHSRSSNGKLIEEAISYIYDRN